MGVNVVVARQSEEQKAYVPRLSLGAKDKTKDPVLDRIIHALGVHTSDGRFNIQGTWADKMKRFGARKPAPIGEIRSAADLAALPRDMRCYAVYLPSQKVIRWAAEKTAVSILGGARHDYLNRGDSLNEENPRRGFITMRSDGTVLATSQLTTEL